MYCSFTRYSSLIALLTLVACGDGAPDAVQCMSMGGNSGLVANAALVRIDLYTPDVACEGGLVAAGAPAPLFSRSFGQGNPIQLDVAPGQYTIALSTWSDAAGSIPVGAGCAPAVSLLPAQKVCIDLVVVQVDASAAVGCIGSTCPCTPTEDDCPVGEYCATAGQCVPGCKSNADCTGQTAAADGGAHDGGAGAPLPFCDPTRHTCVECLTNTDCPVGDVCTATGTCVQGCNLSAGKGCPANESCCNSMCLPNNQTTSCGASCAMLVDCTKTVQNATNVGCSSGACIFTCKPGFADCDKNPTNGCEVNLKAAGTCGTSCGTVVNCGATVKNASNIGCNAGSCSFSCAAGFGDCNGNTSDGCETNIDLPTSCGTSCATAVDCTKTVQNASNVSCTGGSCSFTCNANMGDCDGNPSNGCESNLTSSVSNCGACGRACSSSNVAAGGLSCSNGLCNSTCSGSALNCNQPAAPGADDGCETTTSDPNNCGGCGNMCMLPNATSSCTNATCSVASCSTNFANCDGSNANGCECPTGAPSPGCCGTGCQTAHVNGPSNNSATPNTGQSYYDCYPIGVPGSTTTKASGGYDPTVSTNNPLQMGIDARAVFKYPSTGGSTSDPSITCGSTTYVKTPNCVRRTYLDGTGATRCITWCFADDTTPMTDHASACYSQGWSWCGIGGHLYDSASSKCFCPWPTDPTWD